MFTFAHYDFSGRVAIVTGGAQGIGAALTDALRKCGATVSVWDRNVPSTDKDAIGVDVTDMTAIRRATEATLARYDRVDILVNNAGYSGATLAVENFSEEEWHRIVDINLNGTFRVCKAVVPLLKRNGWGRIVNVASLAGKEGTPNSAAYSASKAGVIALSKALGKELAGTGVLVNTIAPAAVKTTLLDQMGEAHVRTMIEKSPLKRLGTPDEVVHLILWLCSDSCSFNTGAVFDLSGGRATY
jgi:NAD(P)-dependent dehydrogenase (short-subunit alcohol dehydrogenase family)